MNKTLLLAGLALLLSGAACLPDPISGMQTLAARLPAGEGPLGGQVAALPTPDPQAATATPAPSIITLPTPAPTLSGLLATMTAVAGLIPTVDLHATPYVIELQGRPHLVEFQAPW